MPMAALAPARRNPRTGVAAAHRHDRVERFIAYLVERFRMLHGQVDAALGHEGDGARIDLPRGTRSGRTRLDVLTAMRARERLRHLAAVGVFHADEQYARHRAAQLQQAGGFAATAGPQHAATDFSFSTARGPQQAVPLPSDAASAGAAGA
jgi:predicted component of type VI protein secretion system